MQTIAAELATAALRREEEVEETEEDRFPIEEVLDPERRSKLDSNKEVVVAECVDSDKALFVS